MSLPERETDEHLPDPPEFDKAEPDECRVWIGNLDQRINEFAMLKLLQKYGSLKNYDFLYHKSGPDQGKPRGYCFATYTSEKEALKAIKGLNGKLALSKRLIAKHAKPPPEGDSTDVKSKDTSDKSASKAPLSAESQIRAIEAKLQQMEKGESSAPSGGVAQELAHSYGSAPTNAHKKDIPSTKPHRAFSYKRQRNVYHRPKHRR